MKKLVTLLILVSLFSACQKEPTTQNDTAQNVEDFDGYDASDPDEIGYFFDAEKPDIEDRAASPFKIVQVITNDSLPIFRPDGSGKKQKYGKRQIVYTDRKTRFYLRGYGFKNQNDSSTVKAYIKNVEQPSVDIISWSDTLVVVDFPVLTSIFLINNTFSIKFKLFRSNDKAGRTNTTRVRSRTCISKPKSVLALSTAIKTGDKCSSQQNAIYDVRINQLHLSATLTNENLIDSNYSPQVGDILYGTYSGGIIAIISKIDSNGIKGIIAEEYLGETCRFQTSEYNLYHYTNSIERSASGFVYTTYRR